MRIAPTILAAMLFIAVQGCKDNGASGSPKAVGELELASDSDSISFIALGDSGTGGTAQYQVADTMRALCAEVPCDFALILGDNIYESGVSSVDDKQFQDKFELPYRDLQFPIYLVLGNHDYKGNIDAQIKYSDRSTLWNMPARYYKLDVTAVAQKTVDPVTLVGLDTNVYPGEAEQQTWLTTQLTQATTPWRIVFGHHPIYSYGDHGGEKALEDSLLPTLCDQKVDLYLAGHEHDLQLLKSDCVTDMVISGAAGKIRRTSTGERTQFAKSTFGFAYVRVTQESLALYFIDMAGSIIYTKEYTR